MSESMERPPRPPLLDENDRPGPPPIMSAEPRRSSKGLTVFIAAFALVAFGGIVWYAYDQGRRTGSEETAPLIRADTAPVRVRPEKPGGLDVPHQDKLIFEKLAEGGSDAERSVERLLPRPEEPAPPPPPPAGTQQQAQPQTVIPAPAPAAPPTPPAEQQTAAIPPAKAPEAAPPPPTPSAPGAPRSLLPPPAAEPKAIPPAPKPAASPPPPALGRRHRPRPRRRPPRSHRSAAGNSGFRSPPSRTKRQPEPPGNGRKGPMRRSLGASP